MIYLVVKEEISAFKERDVKQNGVKTHKITIFNNFRTANCDSIKSYEKVAMNRYESTEVNHITRYNMPLGTYMYDARIMHSPSC